MADPRALFEMTRPANATLASALTVIGAFVAGGAADLPLRVAAAFGATWFATGGGMAINDYFDREIDAINRPDRPIPRGAVSPTEALAFSIALFLGAIVCAVTLPLLALAIAALNLLALVAYTRLFKGQPAVGNVVVAYLGGSTFLFGGAAVGAVRPTVVLFVLAALSTLAREIIKDVEDLAGDRAEGLRTLPIVVGQTRARWAAIVALAVAVAASPVPYLQGTFGWPYLVVVLPADAVMVWAAGRSASDPSTSQRFLKIGMFLAAAAFVAGRVGLLLGPAG